jgi:hypothetical protein
MILLPSHMYRRLQELFPTCRSPQEGRPLQIPMSLKARVAPGQPPPAGRPPQLRPSRQIWPWARYRPPGTESSTFGWECLWQARFSVSHSSHKGEQYHKAMGQKTKPCAQTPWLIWSGGFSRRSASLSAVATPPARQPTHTHVWHALGRWMGPALGKEEPVHSWHGESVRAHVGASHTGDADDQQRVEPHTVRDEHRAAIFRSVPLPDRQQGTLWSTSHTLWSPCGAPVHPQGTHCVGASHTRAARGE